MPTTATHVIPAGRQSGFTLVELLVTMTITTVILGATMTAMTHAINATDLAIQLTSMNNNLRTSMDVMVRDMLQVGQALPSGNVILVPSLAGSAAIRLPAPPLDPLELTKPFYLGAVGEDPSVLPIISTTAPDAGKNPPTISAVLPGPGLGPTINGIATDVIVTLSGDSSFDHIRLSCNTAKTVACSTALATTGTNMTVWNGPSSQHGANITNGGADDLRPGDLIMLTRGATSALVQVTSIEGQKVNFASGITNGDLLNLNQQGAGDGTVKELATWPNADVYTPPNPMPADQLPVIATEATRIRMVTYYIDALTDKDRPRLVRRINFGIPTAVAFDVEGLSISYDLVDGDKNPANVRMDAADLAGTGTGRCVPEPCSPNQIRKINIMLSARSKTKLKGSGQHLRNRLITQVSFRSLAFVDRYQ